MDRQIEHIQNWISAYRQGYHHDPKKASPEESRPGATGGSEPVGSVVTSELSQTVHWFFVFKNSFEHTLKMGRNAGWGLCAAIMFNWVQENHDHLVPLFRGCNIPQGGHAWEMFTSFSHLVVGDSPSLLEHQVF